ncbi:MAG: hypothetical protein ACLFO1_01015 [Spirochaetaceae bacterium]
MSTGDGPTTLATVNRLISAARRGEEQNLNTYGIYSDITTHGGLRNLLSSMSANISDHLAKLEHLERTVSEANFDRNKVASLSIPDHEVEYAFDASMEYKDFLREIHRREEAVVTLYDTLASISSDDEVRFYFERMAEDGRKHMWLAKDRSDLEALL